MTGMKGMRGNVGGALLLLSDGLTGPLKSGRRVVRAIHLLRAGAGSEGMEGVITFSFGSMTSARRMSTLALRQLQQGQLQGSTTSTTSSASASSASRLQSPFLARRLHHQSSAMMLHLVRSMSSGAGKAKSAKESEGSGASGEEASSADGQQTGGGGGGGGGDGGSEGTGESVDVVYFRGLPQFTVPLPSRRESCRFIVKPLSNTVGDLLDMIRLEDRGVDRVALLSTKDGVRIGASNTIEMLMEEDFDLVINDKMYRVITPPQEKPSPEEIERLSSVRNLVGQLYAALNVDEHQLRVEREMLEELEKLQLEVEPLEKKRALLAEHAQKRTNLLTWVGLGLMSVQFGILARLTWWEYSWDIMEPVTYFVTYGTAMLAYAYFVLTKQEYVLPEVKDRQYLIEFHKHAKKVGLDVGRYNELKDQISSIETDLKRLRDPLALHLPLKTRLPKDFDLSKLSKDSSYYSIFHRMQMMLKK